MPLRIHLVLFQFTYVEKEKAYPNLKPWPNRLASSRKLKTYVYLRLRLALHSLTITCAQFGRDEICTQVKAIFFTVWPPNPSQRKLHVE